MFSVFTFSGFLSQISLALFALAKAAAAQSLEKAGESKGEREFSVF